MRTMPSVTEITVPWLRMSALEARPSIRLLISSLISAGLSCMTRSLCAWVGGSGWTRSGGQRDFHLFETGLDGGVEHLVADHHADAADEGGILLHGDVEPAAEPLLQRLRHVAQLRGRDRERAVDHRVGRAAQGVLH